MGSFSSGNGVHTESGVFCSLNRPQNTFSMSSMEKAHTAEPGILWRKKYTNLMSTFDSLIFFFFLVNLKTNSSHSSPVHLCGENTHHRGNSVDVDDVSDGLKHIEVEERFPWHGAIQPRLHKRRPVLLQHPLWPTDVILTDPGHARIHNLRGAGGLKRTEAGRRGRQLSESHQKHLNVLNNTSFLPVATGHRWLN